MLLDISFEYIVIAVDALDAELGDEVGRATLLFKLCDALFGKLALTKQFSECTPRSLSSFAY